MIHSMYYWGQRKLGALWDTSLFPDNNRCEICIFTSFTPKHFNLLQGFQWVNHLRLRPQESESIITFERKVLSLPKPPGPSRG